MKIFSFREIYALHFLSEVDYLRAISRHAAPPIRGDLLSAKKLFKRSLTHVRPVSIQYCTDEPKILSNLAWIPRYKIPRRYFLYFMSSRTFCARTPRNFDNKNTFCATTASEVAGQRESFVEKSPRTNCNALSPPIYNIISLFVYLFCNAYATIVVWKIRYIHA